MAKQMMREYDLPVKQVSFLTQESNTLFKVTSTGGEKFVLRISSEESTLDQSRVEVLWLNALRHDTNLNVIEPVARKDGQFITSISTPGVPHESRGMLFRWVPGRVLEVQITPAYYTQLGAITAQLHNHAQTLHLLAGIQLKRWDRVFYYPGEQAVYHQPIYRPLLSEDRLATLDDAVERCNILLKELYTTSLAPILIHADLHYANIHVYRGQLYLLDFEDILLGFPAHDIAITLYYGRNRPDYNELVATYRQGYTHIRPWPDVSSPQLAGLMAARNTNFINYVLVHIPEPAQMLEGMFIRLKQSLAGMST